MDNATKRLINAIGELVTNYPTADGGTSTLTITDPDGMEHRVGLDAGQVEWIADLVERGREDADRSHDGHPDQGVCAHCEQTPETVEMPPPTPEELAQNPALVVLIGGSVTGHDILESYPTEWVVSVEAPQIPGPGASALGTNIADTPLTARLRERLPVVLAPHRNTLGKSASFARADILAVAATYGVPAYAVLTPSAGAPAEEFEALPSPATLTAEGWLSY